MYVSVRPGDGEDSGYQEAKWISRASDSEPNTDLGNEEASSPIALAGTFPEGK